VIGKLFSVFFLLIFCFCIPFQASAFDSVENGAGAVQEVMDYIYCHHISRPDVDELTEGAIKGMIDKLNDPYTEYLSSDELNSWMNDLDGKYSGIGVELESGKPYPVVTRIINDSPAAKSGLLVNDEIIEINGRDISGQPLPAVVEEIRGPGGSEVVLSVRRTGNQEFDFRIKRGNVTEPSCTWRLLPDNIGYIYIHIFSGGTAKEFQTVLDEMQKAKIKGLILDLRGNSGGYLQAAEDMAANLLPPNQLIVTTVDRNGKKEDYKTPSKQVYFSFPAVILINGYTASAAEVFAGAMADHKIAKLVGTRSYGKGLIQALAPLETGGALKLTIASYLTPNGKSINQKGLYPDQVVSTPELQLVAARWLVSGKNPRQVKFALNGQGVFLDGEKILEQANTLKIESDFYLPLRPALEALGYMVEWKTGERSIFVTGKNGEFLLPANMNSLINREGTIYAGTDVFKTLDLNIFQENNFFILENK